MEEGYGKLGEVFTVPVAHKRVTFLIGPDVVPHFFKATDDEMSQQEASTQLWIPSAPLPGRSSRAMDDCCGTGLLI